MLCDMRQVEFDPLLTLKPASPLINMDGKKFLFTYNHWFSS